MLLALGYLMSRNQSIGFRIDDFPAPMDLDRAPPVFVAVCVYSLAHNKFVLLVRLSLCMVVCLTVFLY